jgi:hypothetical protein
MKTLFVIMSIIMVIGCIFCIGYFLVLMPYYCLFVDIPPNTYVICIFPILLWTFIITSIIIPIIIVLCQKMINRHTLPPEITHWDDFTTRFMTVSTNSMWIFAGIFFFIITCIIIVLTLIPFYYVFMDGCNDEKEDSLCYIAIGESIFLIVCVAPALIYAVCNNNHVPNTNVTV